MLDVLIRIAAGAILGFLIGLTGVGGGVLTVPVLMLIIRLEPITAVGTASLFAVLTKTYAGIKHYRQGTINVRAGLTFLLAALPGVILASFLVKWTKSSLSPEGVDTLQNVISYVIMASIGFSLATLLVDYRRVKTDFFNSHTGRVLKILCVFLIGAVLGMTSIGGGILIIPALLIFYRETTKYVGTSIFVALLSMAVMSCIYAFLGQTDGHAGGDVNVKVAALMAVGSLVGAHYGAALSKKIPPRRLQMIIIGVIILAVAMMALDRMG